MKYLIIALIFCSCTVTKYRLAWQEKGVLCSLNGQHGKWHGSIAKAVREGMDSIASNRQNIYWLEEKSNGKIKMIKPIVD